MRKSELAAFRKRHVAALHSLMPICSLYLKSALDGETIECECALEELTQIVATIVKAEKGEIIEATSPSVVTKLHQVRCDDCPKPPAEPPRFRSRGL